jgi:hypothetical protein
VNTTGNQNNTALAAVCLLLGAVLVVDTGCVRRRVTITTAPEGASVILNDEEIGTSPVTVDFIWYGDYDVIVRRPGC